MKPVAVQREHQLWQFLATIVHTLDSLVCADFI